MQQLNNNDLRGDRTLRTQLFSRNVFLGVLLAFVLAFGVQGSADALEFRDHTSSDGDLQTVTNGLPFTISFSVSLGSNTTRIIDANGKLIKDDSSDGGPANARIDSSGYLVVDINGREYRTIETNPTGDLVVDPRPTYNDGTPSSAGSPTSPYYVDSSRNVVDSTGAAVYVQTGGGTRADPGTNTAADPWSYTRAKADPTDKVPDANRYHYNEEAIEISVPAGTTLIKVGNYQVNVAAGDTHTMDEMKNSVNEKKLVSSIRLTYRANAVGPQDITITDLTPTDDKPRVPQPLRFRVYVVGPLNSAGTTVVNSTDTNGVERVSDQADTRIDGDFTQAANEPVYYTVEGSGRLYVSPAADDAIAPVSDRKTSPTNNLYTSSSAPVFLDTNGGSSKVTAYIAGSGSTAKVLYVFSGARISELPQIEVQDGDNQTGAPEGRLDDYFEVRVTDGRRRPISGLPVTFSATDPPAPDPAPANPMTSMFIPVPGTNVYTAAPTAESIDAGKPTITVATSTDPGPAGSRHVQTDRNGVAKIYYQLSSNPGRHPVTATAYGVDTTATLTATASTTARARLANLEIVSGNNQRGEKGKYLKDDLVVIVRSLAGHRVQNAIIQFRTTTGTLVAAEGTDQPSTVLNQDLGTALNPRSGQQIYVETGPNGEAGVSYNVGQVVEARDVIAEVREEAQTSTQYDFAIDRVVFRINGSSTPASVVAPPSAPTNRILITPSPITGEPGEEVTLSITSDPTSRFVTLSSDDFSDALFSPQSGTTPFTSTLTLPDTDGDYDISASSAGLTPGSASVTVETGLLGEISISTLGSPSNGTQVFTITVRDTDGDRISRLLRVRVSGTGFTATNVDTQNGIGDVRLTLPTRAGRYTLTASAEDYEPGTYTVPIAAPETDTSADDTDDTDDEDEEPEAEEAPPVPASVSAVGPILRSGTVNSELEAALIVKVTDADDNAVENANVIFRVRKGQGRLSQRGNGRAIGVRTNAEGIGRADYTPLSASSTVEAEARGVTRTVTFTITTGAAPQTDTSDSTPSPKTYKAGEKIPISPDGTLSFTNPRTLNGITYTCVGAGPCVVSHGFVTKGEIRSAPAKAAAPRAYKAGEKIPISMDDTLRFTGKHTVNGTIYTCVGPGECVVSYGFVTKGQIEEATAPATSGTTEMDVEVQLAADARPVMYWIAGGSLYRLSGAQAAKIADTVTDVAVGAQKLYWIQQTGEKTGAIHQANLNGSNAKVLKTLTAAPKGLALDRANGKLYLTNGWGKIQRMNLNASGYESNFITGLSDPMHIAVADGHVYWTETGGRVRATNITGAKVPRNIVTGAGAVTGLAAGGGKVFWTEHSGVNRSRVRSANPDGTGVTVVYTVTASVYGLALDPANNRLYWTNGWGKVQRSVNATRYQDVVTGLVNPTAIAIGGANTAPTPTKSDTPTAAKSKYDINGDGTVDVKDSDAVLAAVVARKTDAKYDVNGDGKVNINDVVAVTENRNGGAAGAPTLLGMKFSALEVDRLQEQIDLLIATNDRSPAAMRTLVYLQQLIVMARPEKTQLLANYPNPFNPETWIPYELATDTNVKLTIYNAQGVVIRTLQLGQQSAGYYTDRERAAYWDGRNALGEQVASGIYFYQLETDDMSSLRKMVILK